MPKKLTLKKSLSGKKPTTAPRSRRPTYASILTDLTQLIRESRRRALASVNRELVCMYWQIGRTIVEQQNTSHWGDAVVERLATDLSSAFPDMSGLTKENMFRARKFYMATTEIDAWLTARQSTSEKVATLSPLMPDPKSPNKLVATVSPQFADSAEKRERSSPLTPLLKSADLPGLIPSISWSHHKEIIGACESPAERYFYMSMSVRERWSVRELRRQIDADLFTRYVSVQSHPEKCLPTESESGELLPFKDHYVLEFLGLRDEHSEQELRKSILANLRDFFLEFGKDLSFVGEEYPLTVGADTFHIDLLFFHRRLQCLIAVELKKGKFKPEHVGKSRFYCAALDEELRLPHENPSIGLVLCKSADRVQVRMALTAAANKIGVATYQTILPDEREIQRRLEQLPNPPDTRDD